MNGTVTTSFGTFPYHIETRKPRAKDPSAPFGFVLGEEQYRCSVQFEYSDLALEDGWRATAEEAAKDADRIVAMQGLAP